jgi:UV excision repair protein RAD23
MKLTFKDLKQQRFTIEAEPTETIGSVKAKIASEKGWEPSTQKLIYSGKILQDDNTIESYKIEEKGFIVCMTSKPKPAPKPAAPPATPAQTSSTPAPPAAPASQPSSNQTQPPATPSPAPAAAPNYNDPNSLAMGEQRSAAVANMESMGFARSDIDRAMRAAFFNPDRAVEYLLTSTIEHPGVSGPDCGH